MKQIVVWIKVDDESELYNYVENNLKNSKIQLMWPNAFYLVKCDHDSNAFKFLLRFSNDIFRVDSV